MLLGCFCDPVLVVKFDTYSLFYAYWFRVVTVPGVFVLFCLFVSLVFKQGTNQCMTISACVVLLVGSVVLVVSPRKITGSLSAVAVHMSAERSGCVLNAVHCAACLSA